MAANDLVNQLGSLSQSQLDTITFLSGVDQTGTTVASGAYFIDQKIAPTTWQTAIGAGASGITFAFDPSVSASVFTPAVESSLAQALALWSDLANINFTFSNSYNTADVTIIQAATGSGTLERALKTTPTADPLLTQTTSAQIQLNLDPGLPFGDPSSYTTQDGYGVSVLLHEVGHLLGLGHSGQYNQVGTTYVDFGSQARSDTDVRTWSTMSYIDPRDQTSPFYAKFTPPGTSWLTPGETPASGDQDFRAPFTPMGLDIFAAQRLYGAPTNGVLSGGQTFGFNSNIMYTDIDGSQKKLSMYDFTQDTVPVVTLYDSGTNNTLDLSLFTNDATVDLDPGTWTSAAGLVNNIFIEYGTKIDAAVGGAGSDTFTLNADGDTVDGGAGSNSAIMGKSRSAYSFGRTAGAMTLTDIASGAVNTLKNIQQAVFAGGVTVAAADLSTITWTGAADDQFNNKGNWDLNQVPGSGNDVVIDIAAPARVDKTPTNFVDSLQIGALGTLQIDTGQFSVSNSAKSSLNAGEIDVNAAGTQVSLYLAGTFQNNGVLSLLGPEGDLLTNDGTVTISGAGTISMTRGNIGGRTFADATPFDTFISSNLIHGSGVIGLDGFLNSLNFINQGTVNADDVLPLTIAGSVANNGLLTGSSALASLVLDGSVNNASGMITAQDGGSVQLDRVTIAGGTINAIGSGKLDVTTDSTLDGSASTVTLDGDLVVDGGAALTITGKVTGGTIDASAGTVFLSGASIGGAKLIGGAGHIKLAPGGNTFLGNVTFTNGLTLGPGQSATFAESIGGGNAFANPTTIALQGDTKSGATLLLSSVVTLSGGGSVVLGGDGNIISGLGLGIGPLSGADWLVNLDNTITGAGLLGGTALRIDNLATGTIMANGGTLVVDPGSQRVVSDGWVGAAPGADLVLIGTLDLQDTTLDGIPGIPTIGNTGTVTLGGTDLFRSAVGLIDAGIIPAGLALQVAAPGGELVSVTNNTSISVLGDAVLGFSFGLHNNSTIGLNGFFDGKIHHGATLVAHGDTNLQGGGTVTLRDAADTIASITNSDTLENVDNMIAGTGQIGGGGLLNLINFATINANVAGAELVLNGGTGSIVSVGLMEATNGGTLTFDGPVASGANDFPVAFGLGTIAAIGPASVVSLHKGGITDGDLSSQTGGVFDVTGDFSLTGDPQITGNTMTNDADLHILAGQTLTLLGSITNNNAIGLQGTFDAGTTSDVGAVLLANGTVSLDGGGTITLGNAADTISGTTGTDELDNHGNMISGHGLIGNGKLGLVNSGTVNAASGLLQIDPGAGKLINNNLMEATTGTLSVATAITNNSELETLGGTIVLQGALNGFGFVQISGGAVTLGGSVSSSQSIEFASDGIPAKLTIADPTHMAANIFGIFTGDTIDVRGVVADSYNYDGSRLNLTSGGTTVASFAMPISPQDVVSLASDKSGGTNVIVGVTCFLEGTQILTAEGPKAVESLLPGDMVQTLLGHGMRPVVWLGHRHIDCARHPDPRLVWPVRIAAHAFGPNLPQRTLWLSPDHAVYANDVLIPVRHLANGTTIRQVAMKQVTYYHVELPAHDVLLAEGLATESYLDVNGRRSFDNGIGVTTMYPDFASRIWEAEGCAPLVVAGTSFAAVQSLVNERAAASGHAEARMSLMSRS